MVLIHISCLVKFVIVCMVLQFLLGLIVLYIKVYCYVGNL